MIRIQVTTRAGERQEIEGQEGQSLMEAIRNAGVEELRATCGGCRSCATCHVYLDGDVEKVGLMNGDEADLLEMSDHRRANSRLSCQVPLSAALDGVIVTIAPDD